jgi:hypothetical protein
MRIISFYKNNRSGNVLHIETEGCIVNIRIGLRNMQGKEVTSVEVLADKYADEEWLLDGTVNNRVIKQL